MYMTVDLLTSKANKRLNLAAIIGQLLAVSGAEKVNEQMALDPLTLNGSAEALAYRCIKCPGPTDYINELTKSNEPSKWVGQSLTHSQQQQLPEVNCSRQSRTATSPPTTIDKNSSKDSPRSRPTNAYLNPVMHRKSKSKNRSNKRLVLSEHMSNNANSTLAYVTPQHRKQFDTLQRKQLGDPQLQSSSVIANKLNKSRGINISNKKNKVHSVRYKMLVPLPTLGTTSLVTLLTIICIETVLLSTMSSCAKTFYMHWNTSNSIFRIDNTDHIIDVNKGNLAFEFDQVHIICPVYEPGAFENETEKYIIYNVSKVEYETCRITNADPRVIAICDKPQKLMFFTITFRPFTPQPGGLEFLPGNDYYFISTSSKDDLYRRIGGRCSTNNMKVVFKVCCAAEEKNKTAETTLLPLDKGSASGNNGGDNAGVHLDVNLNVNPNHGQNGINTIGMSGSGVGSSGSSIQLKPVNGMGTSINTNIDQFNRIPLQPNIIGNNVAAGGIGVGGGAVGGSGSGTGSIMLSPGHGSINMLPPGRGGIHMTYPSHHHIQTGIRINNVPTQPNNPHPHHKGNMNLNNNGKDTLKNQVEDDQNYLQEVGSRSMGNNSVSAIPINIGRNIHYLPPIVDTNHSNIVQSTINWPISIWGIGASADADRSSSINLTATSTSFTNNSNTLLFHSKNFSIKINTTSDSHNTINNNYTITSQNPPDLGNDIVKKNDHHPYDKHPNEVVKNEELTYNSGSEKAPFVRHNRAYLSIGSWLTGARSINLIPLPCSGIDATILLAIIVYTSHYVFWTLFSNLDWRPKSVDAR